METVPYNKISKICQNNHSACITCKDTLIENALLNFKSTCPFCRCNNDEFANNDKIDIKHMKFLIIAYALNELIRDQEQIFEFSDEQKNKLNVIIGSQRKAHIKIQNSKSYGKYIRIIIFGR